MNKYTTVFFLIVTALTGCSGPIETRVQTVSITALPEQRSYMFSPNQELDNDSYRAALQQVSLSLQQKGLQQDTAGAILIDVALADRPASIAITAGDKGGKVTVAAAKRSKPLQSCADREHRLTVTMLDSKTGAKLYQGTAAEYHCKGSMIASLPHLVRAALSNLGISSDGAPQIRSVTRRGIE